MCFMNGLRTDPAVDEVAYNRPVCEVRRLTGLRRFPCLSLLFHNEAGRSRYAGRRSRVQFAGCSPEQVKGDEGCWGSWQGTILDLLVSCFGYIYTTFIKLLPCWC